MRDTPQEVAQVAVLWGGERVEGLSVSEESGVVLLELPARLDISNTRAFVTPVQKEIVAGKRQFILDFADTQSIDSTALGAVVQIFKSLTAQGGALVLCGVGDAVERVLSLTRLDSVFTVMADRESALKHLLRLA